MRFKVFGLKVFNEPSRIKAGVIAFERPNDDFNGSGVNLGVICEVFGYSSVVLSAEHDKAQMIQYRVRSNKVPLTIWFETLLM